MVLTDKKLSILGVLAGVLLAGTLIVYSGILSGTSDDFTSGSLLIQGLDPKIVSDISITQGEDSLVLHRTDAGFVVKSSQSYPAASEKINALFITLDIRCGAKITDSKDKHKDLGVADADKSATVVKLLDKDGKTLTGVVVGGQVSRGAGAYVRVVDQDAVYVSEKSVRFSTKMSDYVNTELLKIEKDDVMEVAITQKDVTCAAARDAAGAIFLKDIPKGKQAKQSEVEALFDALSSLTFDDIASDAKVAADADTMFVCKTKAHATYIVKISKKDDKNYVTLACGGPSEEVLKSLNVQPGDPDAKLKLNNAILMARDNAPIFNRDHINWHYEIPSWTADKMRKSMTDLTEDIPAVNDDPEKVTASHILIGYEGSMRSKATRTKAEAKKLTEDILAKVKAPGADFAALAMKHSEGPSGKTGGSLGEFDKNTMHENFTKGTWKLKVGQISDLVETPFGFHIIKRTK